MPYKIQQPPHSLTSLSHADMDSESMVDISLDDPPKEAQAPPAAPAPPCWHRALARICVTAVLLCVALALVLVGTCKHADICAWSTQDAKQ
jgi:hypothetical protein